jgi:hypothetical protein
MNFKCDSGHPVHTSRANPANTGDLKEQHLKPIKRKKYEEGKSKTDSDWPESKEDKLESG